MGVPREEDREQEIEKLCEKIMMKNFFYLVKKIDIKVPNKMNWKRPTPRYIIIKMPKIKDTERILKAAREKLVTYKGAPVRLSSDFSTETLQARRDW